MFVRVLLPLRHAGLRAGIQLPFGNGYWIPDQVRDDVVRVGDGVRVGED